MSPQEMAQCMLSWGQEAAADKAKAYLKITGGLIDSKGKISGGDPYWQHTLGIVLSKGKNRKERRSNKQRRVAKDDGVQG